MQGDVVKAYSTHLHLPEVVTVVTSSGYSAELGLVLAFGSLYADWTL